MSQPEPTMLVPLAAATAYTLILVALFLSRGRHGPSLRWYLGFLAAAIVGQLVWLAPPTGWPAGMLSGRLLLVSTLFLGQTTAAFIGWSNRTWSLSGLGALAVTLLLDIWAPPSAGQPTGPVGPPVTAGGLMLLVAWAGLSATLWWQCQRRYRQAMLPGHANRLLYWLLALALVLAGEALLFSAPAPLFFGGQALRLAGAVALAYGVASYRLFDVRTRVQRNLAVLLIALLSAIPITVVLVGIQQLAASGGQPYVALLTFFLVVLTFVLYQPFRQLLETVVFRFFLGDEFDTSRVVRRYSQAIARTLDVNELSLVIIDTIGWLLDTGRGALLVVTNDSQGALVEPIPALGDVPSAAQRFAPDDPFISALTQGHEPVLQYDLDFRPTFQALPAAERAWLTALATELFVPVIDRDQLVGIIALGPRRSGLTYRPNEIELLQTLADQTVVALQNARLYSELNTQNERIRRLNRDLQRQYDRLELIDRAKSDFIAIASHELRAPLTQLKGYADILDAMNEENMLTREQTRAIIGHVNRATTQLENLVSAMLDASQLEAESMPLTLMPTALETILRLAVDPLVPVMRERRLKYRTPGITDLPVLKVDFKRMVQAFRSLIGNAVKYTPDGGEITVSADLVASSNGRLDHVEIVVADSGIGIEPQYQELIFEKFFRIDDEQLPSGTSGTYLGAGPGLGLPITRGVIEAHGGRIWVESPGENSQHLPGSRFHIVLPLDPGPSPDGPQPETNLAQAGG